MYDSLRYLTLFLYHQVVHFKLECGPYINDLGLPLDGHTTALNAIMRGGNELHFSKVLEALRFIQRHFPGIKLTTRTVIAQPNLDSVCHIGKTMTEAGIDPAKLRWKLYQVSPVGIRKEEILNGDWLITRNQFDEAIEKTRAINPSFKIEAQPFEMSFGRYFHIFPDGRSHIVRQGKDGLPAEITMGNIAKDFDCVMASVTESFDFYHNSKHGKS